MTRFLLLIVLVAVATLVHPPLGTWAMARTEAALTPAYRRYADWRIERLAELLDAEVQRGRGLPTPQTFTSFVQRALLSESAALDPWGTPYFLKHEFFSVRAGSAGPDRRIGTEDDILSRAVGTGRIR